MSCRFGQRDRPQGRKPVDGPPMRAAHPIEAERPLQPSFRKVVFFSHLMLAASIGMFAFWLDDQPDRTILPPRTVAMHLERVHFDPASFAPLRLVGAWRLSADDPRFGGVSALAIDDAGLIALTDSGAVIRFARPSGTVGPATIRDVPGGPGRPGFKRHRDGEALARRSEGTRLVGRLRKSPSIVALRPRVFEVRSGTSNWAAVAGGIIRQSKRCCPSPADLCCYPRAARRSFGFKERGCDPGPLGNPMGRLSDAVRLPDGRTLVLARRAGLRGFHNALVPLLQDDRLGEPIVLGLGPLDNAEALAAEPVAGGTRLWLMTDDNFRWPMRTLLVALDLPSAPRSQPKSN